MQLIPVNIPSLANRILPPWCHNFRPLTHIFSGIVTLEIVDGFLTNVPDERTIPESICVAEWLKEKR